MVRALIVNPSPVRGGAESSLLEFLTRVPADRVRATVACLTDGPYPDELEAAGARVVRLRAGRLRSPWAWARTVRRLVTLARAHDVVLSWQVKGHYYGTPAARRAHRPAAWWDHGVRPARGEPRYLIDNRLPRLVKADLVLASSSASASRHARAKVILPGIPLEPFRVRGAGSTGRERARALLEAAPGDRIVGWVGRLQPWKGPQVLIDAMALLAARDPNVRAVIVGGTPGGFSAEFPLELRARAERLGVADRVRFLGQRDDVEALLPGFDAFAMTSIGEPFGLVTVEAMAAGIPVVGAASGGTLEILTDDTGVLIRPGDPVSLAAALGDLFEDPVRAGRLAAAGRERAFTAFDIARYVDEIATTLEGLASKTR